MKHFWYKFKQEPYAYGPFAAANERDARRRIREAWKLRTLHGVAVWQD